jgi:hypothetical protein
MEEEIAEGVGALDWVAVGGIGREVRGVVDLYEGEGGGVGPELRYGESRLALVWGPDVRKGN